MSKCIVVTTRADITCTAPVEARRRSMEQAKATCGCQYILSSQFYDMITGRPVGNFKIGDTVKAAADWNGWGLTWGKGADIRMDIVPDNGGASYLSGVELLTPTRGPSKTLSYSPGYGDTRGHPAILLAGARVILYCSGGGTHNAKTPEASRDELVSVGYRYDQAINLRVLELSAGSSSNCDFGGGQRTSNGERVKGYPCIRITEGGQQPPDKEESTGEYTVVSSISVNVRSGPDTGYGKAGAYPCGAVVDVLEARDEWGETDKGQVSLTYLEVVEGPQRVIDNGIAIQGHAISDGRKNRPGRDTNPDTYITIHETGNTAKGTDTTAHGAYLDSTAGEDNLVSQYYIVNNHAIIQHLPDYETTYYTRNGKGGPGNITNIDIEICVNAGGDFTQIQANAASLACLLMEEHSISLDNVVQHSRQNGKDRPKTIQATIGAWEALLALCREEMANVSRLGTDVDMLISVGIIDQPDHWKVGDHPKDTVEALIGKTADYAREDD